MTLQQVSDSRSGQTCPLSVLEQRQVAPIRAIEGALPHALALTREADFLQVIAWPATDGDESRTEYDLASMTSRLSSVGAELWAFVVRLTKGLLSGNERAGEKCSVTIRSRMMAGKMENSGTSQKRK